METPSLAIVDRLYSQETRVHFVNFRNSRLAAFSREVSHLLGILGEQRDLSIWPEILTGLKKLRFELTTIPVPPDQIILDEYIKRLEKIQSDFSDSFPEAMNKLLIIVVLLKAVKNGRNSFLEWIIDICVKRNHLRTCLCLPRSKYVSTVEEFMENHEELSDLKIKLTTPAGLKALHFYNRIFFCGSISLFSRNNFRDFEYVWRSPRSAFLYFLSYDWIGDNFEPEPVFDVPGNRLSLTVVKNSTDSVLDQNADDEGSDDNSLSISEVDFSPVEFIPSGSSSEAAGHYDAICDARLIMLEDQSFVYIELEKRSRILEFSPEPGIQRISNNHLEPGMPLIVRTEGSGGSVSAVADLLFGERAEEIRKRQETWKTAFRRKLFTYSCITDVAEGLTNLGAPTSNEVNVRNWQRSDTIKPKDYEDFRAVMAFSDLAEITDEYWENARHIDLMHKRAGKEISRLLLSRINESSRNELEKYGRIDLQVKGLEGQLSVIRIESIIPEIMRVPSSELNKILQYREIRKWQE